jgi:hypothetical protein
MITYIISVAIGGFPEVLLGYGFKKVKSQNGPGSETYATKLDKEQLEALNRLCDELLTNGQLLDYTEY